MIAHTKLFFVAGSTRGIILNFFKNIIYRLHSLKVKRGRGQESSPESLSSRILIVLIFLPLRIRNTTFP